MDGYLNDSNLLPWDSTVKSILFILKSNHLVQKSSNPSFRNKFESFKEWYLTTASLSISYCKDLWLVALNFTLVKVKATIVNWVEKEEMAAWPATFYCKWEQRSMKHKVITFDTLLGSKNLFCLPSFFKICAPYVLLIYIYLPPCSLESFTW